MEWHGARAETSCLLKEESIMGIRVLSLFLQLPSSGPGGLQPVPYSDPGTEEKAHLLH